MKQPIEPKWKLHNLLSDAAVIGDILQTAIHLEFDLDMALIDFFATRARREAFEELILDELTFHQKIEIFRQLPVNKGLKSYRLALATLSRIKRLRNYVAHGFGLRERDLERLVRDKELLAMFEDYPRSLNKEYKLARMRLYALGKSKGYALSSLISAVRIKKA